MTVTKWFMSDWIAKADVPLTEGVHTLQVEFASLDDATKAYSVTLRCVDTDQVAQIRYFPVKKDGSCNNMAIRTLNSLGEAIFGQNVGIPFVNDILNGVVEADVKYGKEFTKSDGSKGHYINVYSYRPIKKETYEALKELGFKLNDDQYYEGKPDLRAKEE